jgi:hypothetical protein
MPNDNLSNIAPGAKKHDLVAISDLMAGQRCCHPNILVCFESYSGKTETVSAHIWYVRQENLGKRFFGCCPATRKHICGFISSSPLVGSFVSVWGPVAVA